MTIKINLFKQEENISDIHCSKNFYFYDIDSL